METVNLALTGNKKVKSARNKGNRSRKMRREVEDEFESMGASAYSQRLGSMAYGLPCLAMTRRTAYQQKQLRDCERINTKLSKIMRVPQEFVDVEAPSEESSDDEDGVTSDQESFDDFY